jgi:hypothetical protein
METPLKPDVPPTEGRKARTYTCRSEIPTSAHLPAADALLNLLSRAGCGWVGGRGERCAHFYCAMKLPAAVSFTALLFFCLEMDRSIKLALSQTLINLVKLTQCCTFYERKLSSCVSTVSKTKFIN